VERVLTLLPLLSPDGPARGDARHPGARGEVREVNGAMRNARSAAAVRVLVAVRFPGLSHLSDLELDAAWPVEEARRWLTLAGQALGSDGPVSRPAPAGDPPPAVTPGSAPPAPRPTPGPAATEAAPPGGELRRWRHGAGLSQAQVAAAAGLSRSVVSAVEGGRRDGQPRSASRIRLAHTLARLSVAPGGGAGARADREPRS
jgi:DNA-binding XRE family transcriptional regulator